MSSLRCYIDWSGSAVYNEPGGYSLAALIIEEDIIKDLEYDLKTFHRRETRDLDLRDLSTPYTATDLIRGNGDFSALHIDDRVYLLEELVQFVLDYRLKIVSVYFDKSNIYYSNNHRRYDVDDWIKKWTWTLLLERLERFLNQTSTTNPKLILQYINSEANKLYTELLEEIGSAENYVSGKYLDTVEYGAKSDDIFLQITDILVWIIRRYFDNPWDRNRFDDMAGKLFEELTPCFVADKNGKVEGYGMKLFPPLDPVDETYDGELTERQKLALLETSLQVQKKLEEKDG